MIAALMARAVENGDLKGDAVALTDFYLTQLVGDLQLRRVIGAMEPPEPDTCQTRATNALALLRQYAT